MSVRSNLSIVRFIFFLIDFFSVLTFIKSGLLVLPTNIVEAVFFCLQFYQHLLHMIRCSDFCYIHVYNFCLSNNCFSHHLFFPTYLSFLLNNLNEFFNSVTIFFSLKFLFNSFKTLIASLLIFCFCSYSIFLIAFSFLFVLSFTSLTTVEAGI